MDHISKALEKARVSRPAAKAKEVPSEVSEEAADKISTSQATDKVATPKDASDEGSAKSDPVDQEPVTETKKGSTANTTTNPKEDEDDSLSGSNKIAFKQTRSVLLDADKLAENRVIAGLKHDPRSAIFQILRTQVLMRLRKNGWHSIGITSALPGAGKSFISANLAVGISQEVNQTVLLLDLDLRRPKVAEYFDLEPEFGVKDFLLNDVPLSNILVNPGMERLVLLPGTGSVEESSEILSSPKATNLVSEVINRYDSRIVIIDLPPLLSTDDALICVPQVDAVLFVVEDGKTTKDEILRSLRLLEGYELLGTILNKSSAKSEQSYNYY